MHFLKKASDLPLKIFFRSCGCLGKYLKQELLTLLKLHFTGSDQFTQSKGALTFTLPETKNI